MNNSELYDYITNPWEYLLGSNFHWGYFPSNNVSLETATDLLIDKMAEKVVIKKDSRLLDIGCGIGTPALYLNRKFNCQINGVSNSPNGINKANDNAHKNNVSEKVSFYLRDALSTEFESNSFDVVWVMEMSHLISNKQGLIDECFRVLKKGGELVLCDLMFVKYPKAKQILEWQKSLMILEKVFGQARLDTLEYYKNLLQNSGFNNILVENVSSNVIPTIEHWRNNMNNNKEVIEKYFNTEDIANFSFSCDFLEKVYNDQIWGYGIISGKK